MARFNTELCKCVFFIIGRDVGVRFCKCVWWNPLWALTDVNSRACKHPTRGLIQSRVRCLCECVSVHDVCCHPDMNGALFKRSNISYIKAVASVWIVGVRVLGPSQNSRAARKKDSVTRCAPDCENTLMVHWGKHAHFAYIHPIGISSALWESRAALWGNNKHICSFFIY